MNIRQTAIPRRVLSLALCAAMVLTLLPLPTPAEGICNHHPEHTADCGYKAAVEGQDCAHSHNSLCGYQEASPCSHSHDESCGYREASACAHRHTEECGENGESCTHQHDEACGYQEASPCTHSHDESCGYREASPCKHEHDDTCGYVEAVTGSPCTYRCEICAQQASQQQNGQERCTHGNESAACETCASEKKVTEVQALINALPETVTEETREAAQSALSAVEEAKAALTEAEQEKLDLTRYTALKALLAEPEAVDTGKVLTDWEWVDDYELIDPKTGLAHLPFASAENIAYYDAVIEVLPAAITANEEELTLGDWLCEDYPMETGAYEGEYVFETTLPEGYVLEDGTNVLRLTVVLGDPEGEDASLYSEYSTPNTGTHTIDGKSYSDVYELKSANDLFWFAEKVNTGITVDGNINAVLMNDITVPEGKAWTPIGGKFTLYSQADGSNVSSFIGKFDGHGHVIRGLKNTTEGDYRSVGLFGQVGSAEIVNVGIEDSTFTAQNSNCGSLIGSAVGSTNGNTIVKNCYSTATVASNNDSIMVGGLVGRAANLFIQSCYFAGTVSGTGANTGSMIGYGSNPIVRNCYYDTNKCSLLGCGGSGSEYIVGKTTAQFQSGEVAYTLCNGASIWGQNLAGGEFYPKLYQEPHNYKVYGGSQYHNHTNGSQSACLICGGLKPVNGEYQISTKDQLYWFAALVNGTGGLTINSSAKGVLQNDITVDSEWTHIGNSSAFTGRFNGQNHTVTIPAGKSLFDKVGSGATVSKVSVSGGNLCTSNAGIIANCCVSGTGSVKLCGSNSGTIKNCYAAGGNGTTLASGGTITNCYLKADTSESAVSGTGITQGDFQSGKVAYLLNQDGCWGQTVNSDSLPKLGGKKVYYKEGGSPEYHNHSGYCDICQQKPKNSNGNNKTDGNWLISNVDELYWYAKLINGELGSATTSYSKNAVLTADITVNTGVLNPDGTLNKSGKDSLVKWVPIGKDSKNSNTVTFDGQGHTISGLYCDYNFQAGLFGYLYKSTIRNVIILDSYFSGNHVGGVCGQMDASKITNCFSSSMITGDSGVGGICGSMHGMDSDTISNCASSGRVKYTEKYNNGGGVCGSFDTTNDQIINCYYNKDFLEVNGNAGSDSASATAKTTKEFASGEVAYLLNSSTNAGTWKQNLDTGTRDETPNFSGAAVYAATSGACLPGYTNNASLEKNHVFENHVCVFCDKRDQFPISVSNITAKSKTYDGSKSAELVVTFTGKQSSNPNVSVSATGTFKDANAGANKTVTVSNLHLTGNDADKYYLAESGQQTTATATINPKNITVTITPNGGTYDNVTPAKANLNDVVSGQTVPVTLTYTGTVNDGTVYNSTTVPTQVGTYTVTASINDSNYNLTGNTRAEFVIGKATVETPTLQRVTYDGKTHSPVIAADALYKLPDDFTGKKDADTYPLTLALKDTNNCKWDDQKGQTSFTIEKKSLTVTAENKTVTYGDPAPEYTARYDGFVTGETAESLNCVPTFTCNYSVGTSVNQSGYPISVSGLVLSNYEVSYTPGTLTVNPKTLDDDDVTLTVADENLVYTGSALTPDVSVVWGDKTLTKDTDYTVDYSNNVNAGSAPQVTVTGKGNYTGTKSESFTIQPRDISGVAIAVTGDGSLKYTGSEIKPEVTVTNGSYTITATDYEVSYENNVAAGQNTATVKLTGKNNYTGTASQTFSIEKADSTVSTAPAAVSGLTYTGQAQTLVTAGSTSHGTMVYSLTENGTYTSNLPTGTNAGSYTVWYKVSGDDNHEDSTPASVSCSIAQKSLTVTAKDHTITYGDAPANNGVAYDGFVNGETKLDGELTYTYTYSQYGNVGRYDIIPSGLTSGNYDITFANGTLTVNQKEIGITWGNTQFTYSGSEQKPAATPTGLVNNDAITLTVSGEQTNAGSGYTAKVDAIEGTKAGNYALPQSVTTPFSIEKKEVTITGTTVAATKVYDGNTTAQITSDGELQGKCDGDDLTIVCGTAAYDNKNVGESKITFSGFSLGGSAKDNYELTGQPTSVTASITQKPVTLAIKVGENLFDGTNGVNYSTSLEDGKGFVDNDDVAIEGGDATFAHCYPAENIPVTFTAFSLTGADAGNYSITNPTPENVTGSIKVSNRYLNLENNGDFAGQTEVWVDGVACPVQTDAGTYAALPESGDLLTTYTYKQGTSTAAHENYPTGMAVYSIVRDDGGAKLQKIDELDNLLQYSGCSIRINGKPGIRMITSLTKETKEALKKGELAGYTLEEYGTVVAWDVGADMQLPLTLGNGNKHNYAYKKGVSDPVFSNVDNLTQYTNVLVWDSLTDAQLAQDILMRPYIILSKDGETVTLYGGTVSRSIGYVAQQNAKTFPEGSAGYKYVHDIIDRVANLNQSNGSTTTAGG